MAIKRKRHLKYQAKKGRTTVSLVEQEVTEKGSQSIQVDTKGSQQIYDAKNTSKKLDEKQSITRLPQTEVAFVRRELVYLLFVAMVLLALYVVIWFVFRYTRVDEALYSFIRLKS